MNLFVSALDLISMSSVIILYHELQFPNDNYSVNQLISFKVDRLILLNNFFILYTSLFAETIMTDFIKPRYLNVILTTLCYY